MPGNLASADLQGARTYFEFARIHSHADWILPCAVLLGLVLLVRHWYRRDAAELGPLRRLTLTGLRLLALAALFVVYLQPQWRTEHDVTLNSQAILLVDTSLSMGLPDETFPSSGTGPSRLERVAAALGSEKLLTELRRAHDVSILGFDQELRPLATLPKLPSHRATPPSRHDAMSDPSHAASANMNWSELLAPQGIETRLGQALADVISQQRPGPLAGIVLFTDGGQNAGPGPRAAVQLAKQSGVRILPVGLGSDRQPTNVRVSDLVAPARAFPGDSYTVTGYLQAQGLSGRTVRVELLSAAARDSASAPPVDQRIEATAEVHLTAEGEVTPVTFDLTPDETGRRTLTLRIDPTADDSNPADNQQQVDIEIVDQKTRILLFASGPTREYRFLDTLLYRDDNVEVDVLLATAQAGAAQEARRILDRFPQTREELDGYDVIVAFDPDWESLSADSLNHLEHWVANQAGGLIVVPGPIHADAWAEKPQLAKIRDLYPVEFRRRFSLASSPSHVSRDPWPLEFTREGLEADFLWLADSAGDSQQAWASFPGVYECLAVRGPKPGATVYARFSDPKSATGGESPPYFCGQFYGSGRVFYLGSGEMWRLRGVDTDYFDQFYTKLIRHVSQGRWIRGSGRGVLLAERDRYFLGQTVGIRAQLTNPQLEPLVAPAVSALVILPDGTTEELKLQPDGTRPGNFSGQFIARQEGVVRLELPLPDNPEQRLTRRLQVRVPDLERENPRRNDPLLRQLADETLGHYYIGVEDALGRKQAAPIWQNLPDRGLTHPQSEKPSPLWDNWYVLAFIAGCLCAEWLLRRLMRLA